MVVVAFAIFEVIDGLSQEAHERLKMIVAWLDFLEGQYRRHCNGDLGLDPCWSTRKALEETITIIVNEYPDPNVYKSVIVLMVRRHGGGHPLKELGVLGKI